jgi:hypothetical protein
VLLVLLDSTYRSGAVWLIAEKLQEDPWRSCRTAMHGVALTLGVSPAFRSLSGESCTCWCQAPVTQVQHFMHDECTRLDLQWMLSDLQGMLSDPRPWVLSGMRQLLAALSYAEMSALGRKHHRIHRRPITGMQERRSCSQPACMADDKQARLASKACRESVGAGLKPQQMGASEVSRRCSQHAPLPSRHEVQATCATPMISWMGTL